MLIFNTPITLKLITVKLIKRALFILLFISTACFAQQSTNNALNTLFISADKAQSAQVDTFSFRDQQQQKRAISLSTQLRCPQCQNQNLMESNSPIAKDLRLKVYQMVDSGKSDDEIIHFMTDRFGEFVLYKPAFSAKTYLLWFAPFILLVIFFIAGYRTIMRSIKKDCE